MQVLQHRVCPVLPIKSYLQVFTLLDELQHLTRVSQSVDLTDTVSTQSTEYLGSCSLLPIQSTMIEGIFHCNVNCTDIDRSLAFYEMLGFKVTLDFREGMSSVALSKAFGMSHARLRGVHLVLGDDPTVTRIDLVEFQEPKTEGQPYPHLYHTGIARLCFRTQNINQVYKELKSKGINFLSEPQTLPGTSATIVCLTDPDGTVLELLEGTF